MDDKPVSLDLLQRAGELLYGMRWQTALARDLQVSDRMMRYWLAGEAPIPGRYRRNLRARLSVRRTLIERLLAEELAP